MKLLVVEDDDRFREGVVLFLGAMGYDLVEARDAREGWRQALLALPDLILLDLMMPGANGWDFLRWRQDHPVLRAVPVVVISAVAADDLHLGPYRGVTRLPKPVGPERILEVVQQRASKAGPSASEAAIQVPGPESQVQGPAE